MKLLVEGSNNFFVTINEFVNEQDLVKELKNYLKLNVNAGKNFDSSTIDNEGKGQEYFGYAFFEEQDFKKFISTYGNVHGFDGIFIKSGKVYFYESKRWLSKDTLENIKAAISSEKNKESKPKISQVENTISFIQYSENEKSQIEAKQRTELEFLNEILGELKMNKSKNLNMPNDRMLLCVAHISNSNQGKSIEIFDATKNLASILFVRYKNGN